MKIKSKGKALPITIILEKQEEIDQLYALLNYNEIFLAIDADRNDWNKIYNFLEKRKTTSYDHWHMRLTELYLKRTKLPISYDPHAGLFL